MDGYEVPQGEEVRPLVFLILLILLVTACVPLQAGPGPTPSAAVTEDADISVTSETPSAMIVPNPYAPQPGDDKLMRSSAFLTSADLLSTESFPPQIELIVSGNLPTPCHTLRAVIHEPDSLNNVSVEIYGVTDPGVLCEQVLYSFEAKIPLGLYPPGHYTVSVNGEQVGDFNS